MRRDPAPKILAGLGAVLLAFGVLALAGANAAGGFLATVGVFLVLVVLGGSMRRGSDRRGRPGGEPASGISRGRR
jgi:hypothetical protein